MGAPLEFLKVLFEFLSWRTIRIAFLNAPRLNSYMRNVNSYKDAPFEFLNDQLDFLHKRKP